MYNAIAQAFRNAGIQSNGNGKFKDGWSAKLSFRTYKQLQAQGIMQ